MTISSGHPGGDLEIIARIVSRRLGGALRSAAALEGGYSGGSVHRVGVRLPGAAADEELAIKLISSGAEGASPDEDLEARIYGKAGSDLGAAHALLRKHDLPTYDLLARGRPSDGIPCAWVAMSLLPGVSVRGHTGDPATAEFHRMCGEALGALHTITRPMDGPVERTAPFARSWSEAFFLELERSLAALSARAGAVVAGHQRKVRAFIDGHRRRWMPAPEHVLSHPDGLQGHALYGRGRWKFCGHVDVEDFSFTDPRFPLAGFELGAAGPTPRAFWDGYHTFRRPDPTYPEARPVFKLYYVLAWSWMDFSPRYNGTATAVAASLERRAGHILRTIRSR